MRAAGCGPQIALRAAGCGSQIAGCGLRATDCRLLTAVLQAAGHMLWVAKLQVAKMSCCGLLNCGLRFARFFRLGGCQLLDLSGYNMWVTG